MGEAAISVHLFASIDLPSSTPWNWKRKRETQRNCGGERTVGLEHGVVEQKLMHHRVWGAAFGIPPQEVLGHACHNDTMSPSCRIFRLRLRRDMSVFAKGFQITKKGTPGPMDVSFIYSGEIQGEKSIK